MPFADDQRTRQNARLIFAGTQGQRVFVSIVTPSTTTLSGSSTCIEGGGFMDVKTLPATGTYTIPIDPVTTATGSSTLTLYLMPADAGGSRTIGASPLPISIATPGQVVALTLTGTSGQQITVRMTGNTIGHTTVKLLRPDETASTDRVRARCNVALLISCGRLARKRVLASPVERKTPGPKARERLRPLSTALLRQARGTDVRELLPKAVVVTQCPMPNAQNRRVSIEHCALGLEH